MVCHSVHLDAAFWKYFARKYLSIPIYVCIFREARVLKLDKFYKLRVASYKFKIFETWKLSYIYILPIFVYTLAIVMTQVRSITCCYYNPGVNHLGWPSDTISSRLGLKFFSLLNAKDHTQRMRLYWLSSIYHNTDIHVSLKTCY